MALVVLGARLTSLPFQSWPAVVVLAALPAGYVAADLGSGLTHWFCDRFFEEDSPLIGRILIQPFREHHRDPQAMTGHGWLELTGNSCLGMLPMLGLAWAWAPAPDHPLAMPLLAFLVAFALAGVATNLFHMWAHAAVVSPAVAWLQRHRLILPPAAHGRHHRRGHDGAYCVTTGWMNGPIDRLGLFRRLERQLVALGVPATRAHD